MTCVTHHRACACREAQVAAVVEAARDLADAEAEYRRVHDLMGDAHLDTGRAWDLLRRAGNRLRAALAAGPAGEG